MDVYSSEIIFDDTFFTRKHWFVHCIVEYIQTSSCEYFYHLTMQWSGKQTMRREFTVYDNPDEVLSLHNTMVEQILLTQGLDPYPRDTSKILFEHLPEGHRFF